MTAVRKIKQKFFFVLGILALLYFAVCLVFAWIGVSWLWIWPLLAVFSFARWYTLKKDIKFPKWLKILYYTLFFALLISFVVIEAQIIKDMSEKPQEGLDYIIVLGAAIRNGVPTTPLQLRMETALDYMRENPGTVCIASGGQGRDEIMSEGKCMADYLTANGIDPARVIVEDRSTDTEENIRNSFSFIPEGKSVGVVSNSFHLYRAKMVARYQGHEVSGVPATTYPILGVHYVVREYFAVVELRFKQAAAAA